MKNLVHNAAIVCVYLLLCTEAHASTTPSLREIVSTVRHTVPTQFGSNDPYYAGNWQVINLQNETGISKFYGWNSTTHSDFYSEASSAAAHGSIQITGVPHTLDAATTCNWSNTYKIKWIGIGQAPSKVIVKLEATASYDGTSGDADPGLPVIDVQSDNEGFHVSGEEYRELSVGSNGEATVTMSGAASVSLHYVPTGPLYASGGVDWSGGVSVYSQALSIAHTPEETYYRGFTGINPAAFVIQDQGQGARKMSIGLQASGTSNVTGSASIPLSYAFLGQWIGSVTAYPFTSVSNIGNAGVSMTPGDPYQGTLMITASQADLLAMMDGGLHFVNVNGSAKESQPRSSGIQMSTKQAEVAITVHGPAEIIDQWDVSGEDTMPEVVQDANGPVRIGVKAGETRKVTVQNGTTSTAVPATLTISSEISGSVFKLFEAKLGSAIETPSGAEESVSESISVEDTLGPAPAGGALYELHAKKVWTDGKVLSALYGANGYSQDAIATYVKKGSVSVTKYWVALTGGFTGN